MVAFSADAQTKGDACKLSEEHNQLGYHDNIWDNFNGKVKVIRDYKVGNIKEGKNGEFVESKKELEKETRYDREGNFVSSKGTYSLPAGDDEEFRVEFVCEGKLVAAVKRFNKNGKLQNSSTYKHDQNGRRIEEAEFFSDGTLDRKAQYTLDKFGNVIKEINTQQVHPEHFRPKRYDVYVVTSATYTYDELQRLIEEKGFYPDGTLAHTWKYSYDTQNRRIKKVWTDKKGQPVDLQINIFDDLGQLAEVWHYQNFCYVGTEDEMCKGTLTTDIGVFYYGTKSVYTHDKHKNWTKQFDFNITEKDGKKSFAPDMALYREILYY
ncbi:MAG: hypothetical protein IPK98_08435 [Chloracidobacterium sp.]|nr:hypothetical protein [Chloracidobacterium sp.]